MPGAVLRRNNVQHSGAGDEVVVFLHGYGSDQRAWRFVAPAFAATRRVVCLDHVGSGGSDLRAYNPARHGELDGYALDLLEVLDALGCRRVHCVGHSVGGIIALLASLKQPQRFDRLVLVGSSPHFLNHADGYRGGLERAEVEAMFDLMERDQMAWAQSLAPLAMGDQSTPAQVRDFGDSLQALDPSVARRFGRLAFYVDVRPRLGQVAVPSLVLQCAHDHIVPVSVGRYLAQQLRQSTYQELDASGHCPHISHPELTRAAIAQYLNG